MTEVQDKGLECRPVCELHLLKVVRECLVAVHLVVLHPAPLRSGCESLETMGTNNGD